MNFPLELLRLLIIIVVLGLGSTACNFEANNNELFDNGLAELEGEACKIQIRRDYLGGGSSLPIPPTTDVFNGAHVSISGRLVQVDHNGVLLSSDGRDLWIPMDAILLVDFGGAQMPTVQGHPDLELAPARELPVDR